MKLEFNEERHEYTLDGMRVPSVTQILAPLNDFSGIPPWLLEAKADLGTRVHKACELFDLGKLDESSVTDDVRPYLESWRKLTTSSGLVVLETEAKVGSVTMRYAGTLDVAAEIDGEGWIIDRKTSADVPCSAGPQTAAYERARREMRGDLESPPLRRGVALLQPNGSTAVLVEMKSPRDFIVFQACHLIRRHKEEHRG